MKIFFSKQEYRALLDMLFVAEWAMGAHDIDFEKNNPQYNALSQKVLSFSKEMNAEDIIMYDKTLNGYFPTAQYEERLHDQYIDAYENSVFWEELADRLAYNELIKSIGIEQFDRLEHLERFSNLTKLRSKYEKLLELYGLDCLSVNK
jgi:hypothetical protein